jgi:ABC-type phosphate transport system substrate-binding protein
VLVGSLLSALVTTADAASPLPFKVIVHPGVTGKSVKRQVLGDIFLRRVGTWGDGSPVSPVDLLSDSPTRRAFIKEVLGLSAFEVQQYWVAQMSRGRVPPPTRKSEDEVIAFVAANRGAIGYVAGATPVPDTVKVLAVE